MKRRTDPLPPQQDIDALVDLLESLAASGSQHINLDVGEEMRVQTVSSTECSGRQGPCMVPNFEEEEEEL